MARLEKTPESPKPAPPQTPETDRDRKVPTFSIPFGDPYVDGIARFYDRNAKSPQITTTDRPLRLRADDPCGLDALLHYAFLANGSGDTKRLALAQQAIVDFKAYNEK